MLIRFGKKKQNKYHNEKCAYKGIEFASKKERDRYIFLEGRWEAGEISNLRTQVKVELLPAIYETETVQLKTKTKEVKKLVQKPVYYVADFVYEYNGETIYEDTKSKATVTKVFALKKKMMRALKGIDVKENYNPTEWIQHKPRR